jgi:hypothetical protein
MDNLIKLFNCNSRGPLIDPPAVFHPSILVGAGSMMTPGFISRNNITHVINCAFSEHSPSWWRIQHPDKYACIEAIDSPSVSILTWYPQFKETLDKFLLDPHSGRIFIHCQMGVNRSAFLTLAYVCQMFKYPMKDVILGTIKQRACLYQNTKFLKDVSDLLNNG